MEIKKCFKCNLTKSLSDYYCHPQMADKHLGKCKKCVKEDVLRYRLKNIDKVREYDRERAKLPHRIKQSVANTKRKRKQVKGYQSAHGYIARAVKSGKIKKPELCESCNCMEKIVGHHPNYNEPLKVIWVCSACHSRIHYEVKKGGLHARTELTRRR